MRFTKLGQIYSIGGVVPVLLPLAALAAFTATLITLPILAGFLSFWQAWGLYALLALALAKRLLKPRLRVKRFRSMGRLSYDA